MEEFEIKFLDIEVPALEKKLLEIGAEKVGTYNYIRALFDYPNLSMNERHSWVRLRTDGKETTLTYKEDIGIKMISSGDSSDSRMKEIEISVDNYEKARELLLSMGLVVKREEKNKRIRYVKGNVVFDIDFWPQIPPYVEIESDSLESSRVGARELGFDPKDGLICSAKQIYAKYGFNKDEYSLISFEKMVKK